MPLSKRSQEGWLFVDHRAGAGLPAGFGCDAAVPVGRGVFESATITCRHCQRVVVLNPQRTRSRGYCGKCDHYVCDTCEAARVASGGECRDINRVIEAAQEQALRVV